MNYQPTKNLINRIIKRNNLFRRCFFLALDCLILRQWYVKKQIRKYLPANDNLVLYDAGAGFCQYSHYVLGRSITAKVYAVDLRADYLADYNAMLSPQKKGRFIFETADLANYTLPERADIVIAIDILEHIEDDIAVLDNFYQSLKVGGVLIISTPSDIDSTAQFTGEHVRNGYSLDDLANKLTQTGFSIKHSEYSYGFWGRIYWRLIMKNSLLLVGKSKAFYCLLPFYLLIVIIPALICMCLDYFSYNKSGNGLIVVAEVENTVGTCLGAS